MITKMDVSRAQQSREEAGQLPREPIRLPPEALEEVFGFLPRPERERLVLVSVQAADAIVPGANSERTKVGLFHRHPPLVR
jgi:hypothetical protein